MKIKNALIKQIGLALAIVLGALMLSACNSYNVQHIKLVSNSSYLVEDDIDEVVVTGNPNGELLYSVCITIAEREKDLILTLDNANFMAKQNSAAILCENTSFTLTVRFKGQSVVIGGSGSNGAGGTTGALAFPTNWYGKNGAPGQCALRCGEVVFECVDPEAHLTLQGGRGGDGGDAGSTDIPLALYVITDSPNGGNGGDGSPALICGKCTSDNESVNFVAGSGGKGGKGGYCRISIGLINLVFDEFGKLHGKNGTAGQKPQAVK
ncbi:MAG: hypothetical protein K2M47_01465 [Clostridiales bacterium]|nr:hypothetical protein [Clostridiales bacterium]